jgi:hypothetical protein
VLTDVTELSPQERETARFRLRELADRFTVEGTLRTAQWQAVYRRTWRHPYVPCYYPELGAGPLVSAADERQRARWLAAVYSNTPTLAAVDGAEGYPGRAPYDRIIATCSVPAIPPAWLAQAAPGAIIMADVRGLLGGTVVRLRMNDDGVATGRFLPGYASFMPLRSAVDTFPSPPPRLTLAEGAVDSVSNVDPKLLRWDTHVGFVTQWHLPEVTWRHAYAQDGDIGLQLEAPDGSGAQVWHTPANGGFLVRQSGPSRLWDRVEEAHEFWQQAGRPNYARFGITAHATEQYVWYDHPDSPYRWRLPAPTSPRTIQPVG